MDDKIMLNWVQTVNEEFKETRKHYDESMAKLTDANLEQHAAIMREVAMNREEFVIFKTKVNVKTATISGIIGFFVLVTSVALNIGTIKDRIESKKAPTPPNTEILKT